MLIFRLASLIYLKHFEPERIAKVETMGYVQYMWGKKKKIGKISRSKLHSDAFKSKGWC